MMGIFSDKKILIISVVILLLIAIISIYAYINLSKPSGEKVVLTVGQSESYCTIQKINLDNVEAICSIPYPVAREGVLRTLRIGDDIGIACEGISVKLTQIDINSNTVTFSRITSEPPPGGCPICLSLHTLISTSNGPVKVEDVKAGMLVWSVEDGKKAAVPIIKTSSVSVPYNHMITHLLLSDGRQVWVSPNHPTIDGTPVGKLRVGDVYDSSEIVSLTTLSYDYDKTYDILPASKTGFYWANGILSASTLH